jgi:hypothetical protein
MYNNMKPLFASNRAFDVDIELKDTTVSDPIIFPDNISFITWTFYVPSGVTAKLQASTFSQDKLINPVTNLDEYWVNWDLSGDPVKDVNGFITGPQTIQGSLPVVGGLRIVRTAVGATPAELGLRGQ